MRSIHSVLRPGRTLGGLTAAVVLGLAGAVATGVGTANASPPTVNITANNEFFSNDSFWTTEHVTLHATASAPIGSDTITLFDSTTNTLLSSCQPGATTCSFGPITFQTPTTRFITAVIKNGSQVVAQNEVSVAWEAFPVTLSASPTTLPVGGTAQLTATVHRDVGPSNWFIEIFDKTTGTRVGTPCGSGLTCQATVSHSVATTHQFVAYVSGNDPNNPPASIQSRSATSFVTWSKDGWRLQLAAPPNPFTGGTVTATANRDVGPTPFFIMIFDETTGQPLGNPNPCPSTNSCSVSFGPSFTGDNLVAFVAPKPNIYPPSNVEASSNVVFTRAQPPG